MFNVQPARIRFKVGVGEVDEKQPCDFSFQVRPLNYPEGTAFRAVYEPAKAKAGFDAVVRAGEALRARAAADEKRRVAAMQQAQAEGREPDSADIMVPADITEEYRAVLEADLEAARVFCEALPADWPRNVFRDYVSDVEGLQINGEPKTTGLDLFTIADGRLMHCVFRTVSRQTSLTAQEGKALPSPSTSPQGDATAAGA